MRAYIMHGPRNGTVDDVEMPVATGGELLIEVERVGICGTDVELYSGHMAHFATGKTHFPLQPGHEWTGRVSAIGPGVDESWLGRRVTGDTMLGCGTCRFCLGGLQHVCERRREMGIMDGQAGALAEFIAYPVRFAHRIPDTIDVATAAMIEPGGNALRAVDATGLTAGGRLLILGPGTIGLLAAQFALARGIEVHIAGTRPSSLRLAMDLGVAATMELGPDLAERAGRFDAVINATSLAAGPQIALSAVDAGGRLVLIGLSAEPSTLDTRDVVLNDLVTVGILSASPALGRTIDIFASGAVDPTPLIGEVIGLDEVSARLEGRRGSASGPGPKVHVDPRMREPHETHTQRST